MGKVVNGKLEMFGRYMNRLGIVACIVKNAYICSLYRS